MTGNDDPERTLSRRTLLALSLPAASVLPGSAARAHPDERSYPVHPLRAVVPWGPGGPTDVMARILSPRLAARLSQPVVILNRPGAGGNIGVLQAARSPADGYTLLIVSTAFVVNPSLYREPGYDPLRDFLPVTELGASPNVIIATPESGIGSIAELVERARHDERPLDIINPGPGSTPHLTVELLQQHTGIRVENIPYNGAAAAIQALLANTTPVGITALPAAHAHIKSGMLRALAVTGETRWPDLPDVPTMREQGYPDVVSDTFQGMFVPAGTPSGIVQRIVRETLAAMKDPQVLEKLRATGFEVSARGPEALAERVAREVPLWRDVIVQARIEQM